MKKYLNNNQGEVMKEYLNNEQFNQNDEQIVTLDQGRPTSRPR